MSLPGPAEPDVFARLDHRQPEFDLPTAVLWAGQDMLGGRDLVRRLGFCDMGAESYDGVLPDLKTLKGLGQLAGGALEQGQHRRGRRVGDG